MLLCVYDTVAEKTEAIFMQLSS